MRRLPEPPPTMPTNIPVHLMMGRATRRPDQRHSKAQPLKIDLRFEEYGAQIFARDVLSVRTGSAPALGPGARSTAHWQHYPIGLGLYRGCR